MDGTNIEHIVTTPVENFTLDLEAGKIYWIAKIDGFTFDTDHLFHQSNLDGSGVEKFKTSAVQALLGNLTGIAFDPINRKIYASNADTLFVINADDLDIKFADIEFEWNVWKSSALALDIDDRKIYWVGDGERVYRVNLDGTNREELLYSYSLAATFDSNTRKIYWIDNADRQVLRQANPDGSGSEGLFVVGTEIRHIAVEVGPIN